MMDPDEWVCPQLSPHPPGRISTPVISLDWTAERPYRSRVLSYTCSCRTIVYELLASCGMYVIRRAYQTTPVRIAYAGPWRRLTAERIWDSILAGEARLPMSHAMGRRSSPADPSGSKGTTTDTPGEHDADHFLHQIGTIRAARMGVYPRCDVHCSL